MVAAPRRGVACETVASLPSQRRPKEACRDCWAEFVALCSDEVIAQGGILLLWQKQPVSKRPAPHPGPRCASHWRVERDRRKKASHDKRVQQVYGLEPGEYAKLYAFQGGKCWLCRRATGKTRRLSVDHDHSDGAVRGLLCRPCNDMLGHARDESEVFRRAVWYLEDKTPYELMKEQEAQDGLQSLQPE